MIKYELVGHSAFMLKIRKIQEVDDILLKEKNIELKLFKLI